MFAQRESDSRAIADFRSRAFEPRSECHVFRPSLPSSALHTLSRQDEFQSNFCHNSVRCRQLSLE
eukprot:411478-Pyramimonas_sp.AAC.1